MKQFLIVVALFIQLTYANNSNAQLSKCSYANCPALQGVCDNNTCLCGNGFMTVEQLNDGKFCNYKTKSKFIAFLFEFFFPFGVGHLYAENATLAMIKFSLFMIFFLSFCFELCFLQAKVGKCLLFITFIFIVDLILWILLQLVDLIGYSLGYYTDGNGIQMH